MSDFNVTILVEVHPDQLDKFIHLCNNSLYVEDFQPKGHNLYVMRVSDGSVHLVNRWVNMQEGMRVMTSVALREKARNEGFELPVRG